MNVRSKSILSVNIEELIKLEDDMSQYDLGPNGGLVFCMDYLEKNLDWLKSKLEALKAFNLDFYTDVQDLQYLQYHLTEDPRASKYKKLTRNLCEVVDDFGLVNFVTLNIQDKESVIDLVKIIDKSNGYVFTGIEGNVNEYMKIAAGPTNWDYYRTAAVQEKYMKGDETLQSDKSTLGSQQ